MKIKTEMSIVNVLAGIAVLFLGWISFHIYMIDISSAVQASKMTSMDKRFELVTDFIQKQIDDHINDDRKHKTKHLVRNYNGR